MVEKGWEKLVDELAKISHGRSSHKRTGDKNDAFFEGWERP